MKKRTLQLISLLLLFCMAGSLLACKDVSEKDFTEEQLYEQDGFTFHKQITISIEEAPSPGATTIKYKIVNDSYRDFEYLKNFTLEIKGEEGWQEAPPPTGEGEIVIKDIAILPATFPKQTSGTGFLDLQSTYADYNRYAPLSSGEYRIVKRNCTTSDGCNFDLVAYFTITEAPAE